MEKSKFISIKTIFPRLRQTALILDESSLVNIVALFDLRGSSVYMVV